MPQGPTGIESAAWGAEWITTNTASEFHDRTRNAVETHYKTTLTGNGTTAALQPWTTAKDALFNTLMSGFASINAFIGQLSGAITGAIGGTLTTITNFMTGLVGNVTLLLGNLLNAAGEFIGNIAEGIVDGVGTTFQNLLDLLRHAFGKETIAGVDVATGTNVSDLTDAVHNLTDKAFVAVDDTATLKDFWNEPRQLPAWVGAQSDDVSYPHYLINASSDTIFASGTSTQDRLIVIPVVAGQNRVYDVIKFGVTAIAATSLQVALYDVDETSGLATKVIDLGNVISEAYLVNIANKNLVNGGSFRLAYGGQITGAINWNATAATLAASIQSALTALTNIGSGKATVGVNSTATAGSTVGFDVLIDNPVGPIAALTLSSNSLTVSSGSLPLITVPVTKASQINTALTTIQTITLPQPKTVSKGEVFYIAILASGGAVTLSYSSTISGTSLVNYGRYPRFLASYNSSGTFAASPGFPATMLNTNLGSNSTFRPFWGALGVFAPNVIPAKLVLSDSYDRTNASNLGANWSTQYSQFGPGLKIVSNKAQADSGTGTTLSVLVQRLNWLDQRVSATIIRGGETIYTRAGMILMLRGNGSGKFMYLRVTQNLDFSYQGMRTTAQIYSASSYSQVGTNFQGGTLRTTVTGTYPTVNYSADTQQGLGGLNVGPTVQSWKFEAIGNAYYGYLNNVLAVQWTDSGSSAFPYNDTNKQVGVGGLYVARGPFAGELGTDLLGLQKNGIAIIDNFVATDL